MNVIYRNGKLRPHMDLLHNGIRFEKRGTVYIDFMKWINKNSIPYERLSSFNQMTIFFDLDTLINFSNSKPITNYS